MDNRGIHERKFPRRPFRRGIGTLQNGDYVVCVGDEIGEGGVSFWTDRPLKIGDLLVLSFQIPDGSFISVRAEVKNNSQGQEPGQHHYGLSFLNLKFERKREIRTYVTARSEFDQ